MDVLDLIPEGIHTFIVKAVSIEESKVNRHGYIRVTLEEKESKKLVYDFLSGVIQETDKFELYKISFHHNPTISKEIEEKDCQQMVGKEVELEVKHEYFRGRKAVKLFCVHTWEEKAKRQEIARLVTSRCCNCYDILPGYNVHGKGWNWLTPNFGPFCDKCFKQVHTKAMCPKCGTVFNI